MSLPFYVSPSSYELWQLCNARALAKYVWGFEDVPGKAATEGTRLHKLTQRALVTGQLPGPHERAVHKIVQALPIPLGSVLPGDVERVLVSPYNWFGFMDWTSGDGRQGDLKFTGNPQYQRQKPKETDPQRIVYAIDEFYRDPYLLVLHQTWSVATFNGSAALRLDKDWTRKEVKSAYEKNLASSVDKFSEAVHNKQDWQTANKNLAACDTYRPDGCPMKKHGCTRSLAGRLAAVRPDVTLAQLTLVK